MKKNRLVNSARWIATCLFLVSLLLGQSRTPADELADAERAFSAASDRAGVKESFLQFLADDCVMFNPHPVNGKDLYRNAPAGTTHLIWRPVLVEVAASGNYGISTGPWERRSHRTDTASRVGYYFSVWKKGPEGEWKVIADVGLGFPKEQLPEEKEQFSLMLPSSRQSGNTSKGNTMEEAEKEFNTRLKKPLSASVWERFAANNARVYRSGVAPGKNKRESLDRFVSGTHRSTYIPLAWNIAASGDMGFVYGYAVTSAGDSAGYLRVWKKEDRWKIAADIEVPFRQ